MAKDIRTELLLIDSDELALRRARLTKKIHIEGKSKPNTEYQLSYANLVASHDSSAFLSSYDSLPKDKIKLQVNLPTKCQRLTSKEVTEPPLSTEKQNYDRLREIHPRIASMPAFWTSYQVEMIRAQVIEPSFLAAQAGSSDSGRARLEKAMKNRNENMIDACVRTVLRQLGGLREARGNVSLFVDCKLARAWWRGYVSNAVASDLNLDLDKVWNMLRLTEAPWDSMILFGLRRLTMISDRSVRSAFIACLMALEIDKMSTKERKNEVESLMQQIGVIGANRNLGFLSPKENLSLFKQPASNSK